MRNTKSLVAFTLLAQAGIGLVWAALLAGRSPELTGTAVRAALAPTFLGLAFAAMHLGRPLKAPRALRNLGGSWLSRECLGLALFLGLAGIRGFLGGGAVLAWLAGAAGAGTLFSMASIYGRTAFPAWSRGYAQAAFWSAALALGGFALAALAPGTPGLALATAAVAGQGVATAIHLSRPGAWGGATGARGTLVAGTALSAAGGLVFPALVPAFPGLSGGQGLAGAGLLLAVGQVLLRHAFFASAVHPMDAAWADLPAADLPRGRA